MSFDLLTLYCFTEQPAMLLSDLRVNMYTQLATCVQRSCQVDGENPNKQWWVFMAETCAGLDITRKEQQDIGLIIYS